MLNQLAQRRKEKGLSRAEVANRSGIGLSHYTKIENKARVPSLPVANRIAECLGVTMQELFSELLGDSTPHSANNEQQTATA